MIKWVLVCWLITTPEGEPRGFILPMPDEETCRRMIAGAAEYFAPSYPEAHIYCRSNGVPS